MMDIAIYRTPDAAAVETNGLPETAQAPAGGLYLLADATGLSLCKSGEKGRVRAEFAEGAAQHRRVQGGGELIGKAVNHTAKPTVWDATGGLGRDAFVLAGLGLAVTVFERHPAVAALFSDGLRRAAADAEAAPVAARIALVHADAVAEMTARAAQSERPDVVYLDPMYPVRQKSAAVKKEMAYFHELVGSAEAADEAALLQAARTAAKKRVVVKRPRLGDWLAGEKPAYQYSGKSTRFDVYLPFAPQQDN